VCTAPEHREDRFRAGLIPVRVGGVERPDDLVVVAAELAVAQELHPLDQADRAEELPDGAVHRRCRTRPSATGLPKPQEGVRGCDGRGETDRVPTGPPPFASGKQAAAMTAPSRRPRRSDTPPPRTGNSELEVLRGFLDYLRASVAAKVEGAPEPAARTAAVPSGTHLLGLLHHLTHVERATFLGTRVTDWQATFRAPAEAGADEVVARYRRAVAEANEVLDGCTDPGAPLPHPQPGRRPPAVRWALTHLIEETGRHAGHADILRELVDGSTGR
jgi:hypothetical protein